MSREGHVRVYPDVLGWLPETWKQWFSEMEMPDSLSGEMRRSESSRDGSNRPDLWCETRGHCAVVFLGGCMGRAPPLSSREHTAEGAQEIWKAQHPLWERMDSSRWGPGTGHNRSQTRSWVSALHHQREETILAVREQEAWDSQCARTRRTRSSGWPRGQQKWAGSWRGCSWTCIAGEGLKSWWREDCG